FRRSEICFLDFCRPAFRHGSGGDIVFVLLDDARRGRTAIGSFELDSVPVPGIVAGGNHHSAGGAQVLDRIGESWSRRVIVGDLYRNTGGGKNFSRGLSKAARAKARVITDDDAARWVLILQDVSSDASSNAAHILKGVIA